MDVVGTGPAQLMFALQSTICEQHGVDVGTLIVKEFPSGLVEGMFRTGPCCPPAAQKVFLALAEFNDQFYASPN